MAKFVMPEVLDILDDYEPTSQLGRSAEPNPFDALVAKLAATWSDEKKRSNGAAPLKFVLTTNVGTDQEVTHEGARTSITQKFGAAANNAGYSARYDDKATETTEDKDGTKTTYGVVVAYLIPRILRKRTANMVVTQTTPANAEEKTEEAVSA